MAQQLTFKIFKKSKMNVLFSLISLSISGAALTQTKDTTFTLRYHTNKKIASKQVTLTNNLN